MRRWSASHSQVYSHLSEVVAPFVPTVIALSFFLQEKMSRGRDREHDRCISEEEDLSDEFTYDLDFSSNLHSFHSRRAKKLATEPYKVGKGDHGIRDEVYKKFPLESNEEHTANSSSESISDEENAVLTKLSVTSTAAKAKESHNGKYQCEQRTWSFLQDEAKELEFSHMKTHGLRNQSELKRNSKRGRGRAKLKFSIRSHIQSENCPNPMNINSEDFDMASEDPERRIEFKHKRLENSVGELLGYLQQDDDEKSHVNLVPNDPIGAVPSMTDLLEDLQERHGVAIGAPSKVHDSHNSGVEERKSHSSGKRTTLCLGTRTLDDEDPLEYAGDGVSSGDEDGIKRENHASNRIKRQTVTDLFQEIFRNCSAEPPVLPKNKQAGSSYYGRLQQVLQIEKDRHFEFLKRLQAMQSPLYETSCYFATAQGRGNTTTASQDDTRCIMVRILTRYLEAKLIVCHCVLGEKSEDFEKCDNEGTIQRTVIFNSRICGNVELEVGNLVCIHPPWKEILVDEDEKIILCCYFTQIMT